MENIKTLADQLREQLNKPAAKIVKPEKQDKKIKPKEMQFAVLEAIRALDTSLNKSMVHVRFDEKTVRTMNQFKMATEVDVTRLVAFAVKYLFDTCPELKQIIKQFIQNQEL